jgi:hypothetical protein
MREVFSKTVKDERVTLLEGSFDNTGIENGWADLVVIAQVRLPYGTINGIKADHPYARRHSTGALITTALPQSLLAS